MQQETKEGLIRKLQEEVEKAIASGNPPFAALLADEQGTILEIAHPTTNTDEDPTAHAEINLLRKAGAKTRRRFFREYSLFANAASCPMCMTAALQSQISSFYFGAPHEPVLDPNLPPAEVAKHAKRPIHIEEGILADECVKQIKKGRALVPKKMI